MIDLHELLLGGHEDDVLRDDADAAEQHSISMSRSVPQIRVGVALAFDGGAFAEEVRASVRRFPGFAWRVVWLETEQAARTAYLVDVFVCPSDAHERTPSALRELLENCAESEVPIVVVGAADGEPTPGCTIDTLPHRITELVPDLCMPLRPAVHPAQRALAFEEITGRGLVRLPPAGPTVTLDRLDGGARIAACFDDGTSRWLAVSVTDERVRIGCSHELPSVGADFARWFERPRATATCDIFSGFADAIAGHGLPARELLEPLVRRARLWVAPALPRTARTIARAFHSNVRLEVAGRVIADASGRVAQLAKICPGVFVLAVALGASDALDEACARTVRGDALSEVMEPVLARWATCGDGAQTSRHASFARRAPSGLDPRLLVSRFPDGLALDDVPVYATDRLAWFTAAGAFAGRTDRQLHARESRLAAFVSAQGVALGAADPRNVQHLLTRLEHRGQHLGRWPSRRTTVEAATRASARFYDGIATRKVPVPPLRPPRDPNLQVRPLQSAVELAAEGERMHNCLATCDERLYEGELLFLSVSYETARFTASAEVLDDGTLVLDEMVGMLGRPVAPAAKMAMEEWLEEQQIGVRRRDGVLMSAFLREYLAELGREQ